jgi:hypothetical protein
MEHHILSRCLNFIVLWPEDVTISDIYRITDIGGRSLWIIGKIRRMVDAYGVEANNI